MPEESHPADEIMFDEHDSSRYTPEAQDHFFKAVAHHAGYGPHPGRYSPLAQLREEAEGPPDESELAKEKPMPPEEALPSQPPLGGKGGKGGGKPPSGGSPASIGQAAAAPVPPPGGGDF